MPTLRNKTTDKGTIIRWKPHPKHVRPSTYQVTPRAVSFLNELGFNAPSPGDEVTIPPQVCRPLRLLGDLYFESESKDDVQLDDSPSKEYYRSSRLSTEQLGDLRSYVESHPSYIGGFRTELEKEMNEIPGSGKKTPKPVLDPDSQSIRRSSHGNILLPEPYYIGQVDRLSNNKNAMLSTGAGRHINLGKLPKSIVGKWTIGVEYRGQWTMCLAPQEWSSGYRSSVQEYIEELEELTGIENLNKILRIQNRHYGNDIDGSKLVVNICYAGHGLGFAYYGEWTIVVDSELLTAGQRIRVKVEEVCDCIGFAVPQRPDSEENLSTGDRVKLTVDKIGKNILVGTHNNQLVTVPRETDVTPKRILVAITEINEGYVTGSIDSLDDTELPSVEDTLTIQEGKIQEYPNIPVDLPDIPLSDPVPVRLPVTAVNTDSISVSTKVYEDNGLFGGHQKITSPSQHWGEQGLVVTMNDLPIVVHGGRYVPGVDVKIRPTGCTDGFVEAEFEEFILPTALQSAEKGRELGEDKLRNEEYDEAIQAFVGVVEITDKNVDSEEWIDAIELEIIALVASSIAKGNILESLNLLDVRKEDLKEERNIPSSFTNTVLQELSVLRQILEAKFCLEDAEKDGEKSEIVEARQTAKNLLTEAVTTLDGLPSLAGHERPHWFIHDQLKEVTDELLLVSPSVKEYIADLDMKKTD